MNDNAIAAIRCLYLSEEPMTTSDVAKEVFCGDSDVRNADRKVRYYFEDAYDHLVSSEIRGGKKHYTTASGKVFFGAGRMEVFTVDGDELSVGFGEVMVFESDDGGMSVVRIDSDSGS